MVGWRYVLMVAVVACSVGVSVGGCSEENLSKIDAAAPYVQTGTGAAQQAMDGPFADVGGDAERFWIRLGLEILGAAALAWQTMRKGQAVETLASVVRGVELSNQEAKEVVKSNIEMTASGKALVAKLKG